MAFSPVIKIGKPSTSIEAKIISFTHQVMRCRHQVWLTGVHLGAGCQRRNRAGIWKITCIAILKLSFQHNPAPLIEVDAQARILWRNDQAEAGLSEHRALKASGTRLRARNRAFDKGLRDAIVATSRIVLTQIPNRQADEAVCAVLLGEDVYGTPQYCWVFADDGRILVSFDDGAQLDQRLAVAARIAEPDRRGGPAHDRARHPS